MKIGVIHKSGASRIVIWSKNHPSNAQVACEMVSHQEKTKTPEWTTAVSDLEKYQIFTTDLNKL